MLRCYDGILFPDSSTNRSTVPSPGVVVYFVDLGVDSTRSVNGCSNNDRANANPVSLCRRQVLFVSLNYGRGGIITTFRAVRQVFTIRFLRERATLPVFRFNCGAPTFIFVLRLLAT